MTRRVSPLATELTRSWRGLADDAIRAKTGAEHGQRGQRVAEVAQRTRATPVLVRRAVTARVALMRLEQRGILVPDSVFTLPVGVAEAVARWAGRDPEMAWRQAADYVDGRTTFQALIDAERQSRGREVTSRKPRSKAIDPDAWRVEQMRRLAAMDGKQMAPPAPDDLPVQGWLYGDAPVPTAVLVVGPHDDLRAYMAQRAASCVTAVGVARLVGYVVIVVPGDDIRVAFVAWLTERSVPPEEVRVVTVVPARRTARGTKAPPDEAARP